VELSKTPTIPFNIFIDAKYQCAKVAGDELALRSSTTGLGKIIKSNVLSIEEECKMLMQSMCQPTPPFGLNLRFAYFCIQFFFI
jgi:hypothetical protein